MLSPEAGTQIAERYTLTRKLGEGGMGSVWAAHDDKLRRDVAVKLVTERIADSQKALARFEREAMSIARLRSPYITQVYDYGVEDGSPYIIMELLEGEDLKELLARDQTLTVDQTARVVVQVAKALHAAHESGIVHRDLKPANVFIATEHGEQACKVFDFGVAKALNDLGDDSDTTAEGVLLGTPRYMSPEQAHGAKEVDHRTDLWSLGVIAYLCLTGRLPFVAAGTGHVLVKICTEEPPPPSQVNPALPPEVDHFMMQALAKEPEERFQSARELGTAFADLADQSLSSFGNSSPSWEGMSRGRLSSPSMGDTDSAPSLSPSHRGRDFSASGVSGGDVSGADLSFDPSSPGIAQHMTGAGLRAAGDSQDGTLGPAVTSTQKPWLASKRAQLGAGAFALLALGILGGVLLTRSAVNEEPGPAGQASPVSASAPVTPNESASAEDPAGTNTPSPATSSVASAAPSAEANPKSKRPLATRRAPVARAPADPVPVAQPEPTTEPTPDPKPAPKPKPKSGDGLDLFDKRF